MHEFMGSNPSLPTDKASDRLTCLEKSESLGGQL